MTWPSERQGARGLKLSRKGDSGGFREGRQGMFILSEHRM